MTRNVLAALLVLCGAGTAWADISAQGGPIGSAGSGNNIKTIVVTSSTDSAGTLTTGSVILGVKILATAANGVCALYDSATISGTGTSSMIDELREATANETGLQMWPNPYVLVTDLSIGVSNAICIAYYR